MDVGVGGKDVLDQLAALSNRMDIVEQTVTADQEVSLSALEAIMRATQRGGSAVAPPPLPYPAGPTHSSDGA